jgi:glyoxylate carboligase
VGEVVKSHGLEKELSEVKGSLQKESDEHDDLRVVVGLGCDDLRVTPPEEVSSLVVRSLWIMKQAREMTRHALRFGVQQSFVVARSHYENINLEAMGQGFTPGYEDDELDEIEKTAADPMRELADRMEGEVIPPRG